ncbi:specifically androgen-regulated gene protein isoform X1 [Hemibagrus wyckioides]|uniref:specifically androgen-regulated gene protein isoform X1 n=1 Tax=Hemibagrus wyckioides TaxID=337641 RepID=UPI00266BF539|nr:specifically androgen-regulated gene protein isoform X1 [Hemibagrus wyckioides]XP_058265776.1 specifically androgen-regulated gene protein isoform X1 [Hemibagrus wyckioides]
MPMRDSWPCDFASGSSLRVNSVGHCDSVISIYSGYSDDSMEHLSAEERACLMFLEETIESLEAENNNGVSNDEQNHLSHNLTNKMDQLNSIRQVNSEGLSVHDDPNNILGKDHKSRKLLVPTPLVLANGSAKFLKKTDIASTEQKPAVLVNTPKTAAFNSHQSSELLASAEGTAILAPNPGRHKPNAYSFSELTDLPPSFIPKPPVRFNTSSGAKDNPPKTNLAPGSDQKHKSVSSDMPVVLLPPPSDFMDEPVLLPPVNTLPAGLNQPQTSTQPFSQTAFQFPSQPCQSESTPIAPPPGFDGHIGTNKPLTSLSTSPRGQLSLNELDKLRKKASMKKAPEIAPVVQVKSGHNLPDQTNSPTFGPDTSAVTAVEYVEPKSPPNVAPKPKKLPSSIVLKSHKDATPGHTLVSPGDRMMINQQKVHQEALKKLGLLKTDEIDFGHCPSPPNKVSPQTSFTTSTSLASPAERTADSVLLYPEHHAVFEAEGKTDFSYLPVPPEQGERENLSITRAPSPKPFEMKSASMERSGIGLKSLTLGNPSHLSSQNENPENVPVPFGHLRNNRYQPASAGSLKDFSINQIPSESNREPELRRSLPIPVPSQPKIEPQKSLRSHGISVVISPQNKNGEDRKQALRRLGLGMIKD